jgi:hypothetical protein
VAGLTAAQACIQPGMVDTGTKGAAGEGQREHDHEPQHHDLLRLVDQHGDQHREPGEGRGDHHQQDHGPEHADRVGLDAEAEQRPHPEQDRHRPDLADHVGHDPPGQRGRAGDGQAAEAVEDPLGDVGVEGHAGVHGQEQGVLADDAGQAELQEGLGRAGDGAAEDEGEQGHEHQRLQAQVASSMGLWRIWTRLRQARVRVWRTASSGPTRSWRPAPGRLAGWVMVVRSCRAPIVVGGVGGGR